MCAISAVTWQELKRGVSRLSEGRKKKYLECCLESYIAATAISNGMVLVTHNTADFEQMKKNAFLRVEDWFTA